MSAPSPSSSNPELDAEKYLDDCIEDVKKQAFLMKHAFDQSNLKEALRFASALTASLRTSRMNPQNYYELYMNVTDELRELEFFFDEENHRESSGKGGKSVVELYELVQHAGNILPRLYLLITVAAVYIRSKKAPAKDILFDLVELCRGVQHPMRGLFLRNYLSQMAKDKLPDVGSEYEGFGGTVKDSIEFILQNFAEMNKLWVRMQYQGAERDKSKREKERKNLRQLVGTNLVRLSELTGVDLQVYQEIVLPRILEQIVNCRDVLAQEYLMDCIIQVFPDEFHLNTLETYLATCAQLLQSVNVKEILINLMNRLSNYVKESGSASSSSGSVDMFPLFHKYAAKIISTNTKLTTSDVLALQVALLNFATKVYPERIDYVDQVLGFSVEVLQKTGAENVEKGAVKHVMDLLGLPLESIGLQILTLEHYAALLKFLELENRRSVASTIMKAILNAGTQLDTVEKLDALFSFIAPAIKDEGEARTVPDSEKFEFDLEQHLVARLFQLITHADTDVQFQLYSIARKQFGQGGLQRIEYTLPPLVFGSLQLARRVFAREEAKDSEMVVKTKKVFGFIHDTIGVLIEPFPELALRLNLSAAQVADQCGYEAISYEFCAQAFIAYEDQISDSKAQFAAITLIVASLQSLKRFGQENYDTLVSKATQHSAKLLKKPDQCRAVYQCAHLFWPADPSDETAHKDEKRVLACLQKSLKVASACMGQQVHLFVEILNKYLYFYDRNCPSITVKYLKGLMSLIEEHVRTLDNSESSRFIKRYYENTLNHIKVKQSQTNETARTRYVEITSGERGESADVEEN